MKRLLAALAAMMLLCAVSLAQAAPIASYELPAGAEVRYYLDSWELKAPDKELTLLYDLMRQGSPGGDVYVVRMPYGRALATVSCSGVKRSFTAQELLDLWPRIAEDLGVEARADDAWVEEQYGYPMLNMRATLEREHSPLLCVRGFAFCRDGEIREVWAAHPAESTYAEGSAEASELALDLASLEQFLQGLSFPLSDTSSVGSAYATDTNHTFQLMIPDGMLWLTPDDAEEEKAALRELYVGQNRPGADRVFDLFLEDVRDNGSLYVFTEDLHGAVAISSTPLGTSPVGMEQLLATSGSTLVNLRGMFDLAVSLSEPDTVSVSNAEHAALYYWTRTGECNLQTDVLLCALDGWLFEVDLFVAEGDQELRYALYDWLNRALTYMPPQNALD